MSLADNDPAANTGTSKDALASLEAALALTDLPPDDALFAELLEPYPLKAEDTAFFQANGYIKLKHVLSPGSTIRLRKELYRLLAEAFETSLDGGARQRFLSLEMVWLDNPLIRAYVLSPRIAGIAAGLLDVPSVRLYHDNVLSKEPGCGRTPWHYDDHHFPLDSHDVVTAWIPGQPIPREMGPLAFAWPIDVYKLVESVPFNKEDTSYDRQVAEIFRNHDVHVEDGAFELGEASFHHNLSFHTAAPNRTDRSRIVLANTYFADGARILNHPTMVSGDWQKFIPGAGPGDLAASHLNPVCWPAEKPDHV